MEFHHGHAFEFPFEKDFDYRFYAQWTRDHLMLPILLGIIYVSLIMKGPEVMIGKKRWNMTGFVIVWNLCLAIINLFAAARTCEDLVRSISREGFHYALCDFKNYLNNPVNGYWLWMFTVTRQVQILDGLILVLRRKDIPFIHSYKHFTFLYCSALLVMERPSIVRWYMPLLYLSQGIVNSYLFLKALNIKINPIIPLSILGYEVLEKAFMFVISLYGYNAAHNDPASCDFKRHISKLNLAWCGTTAIIYGTYFHQKILKKLQPPEKTEKEQ